MVTEFYHIVHFWLKPDISPEQREQFLAGLTAIGKSENVTTLRIGTPAGTPREVVDNSYDFQIVVTFADKDAHDRYQSPEDAAHQQFIDSCKELWTKVLIYDSLEV